MSLFTWPFIDISAPSHFLFSHLSMGKDWTESTESTPSHCKRRTLSVLIADFCCDPAVRRNTQMMFPAWALTFNVLIIPEMSAVDLKIKAGVCSVLPLVRTGCYLNHLSSRLACQSIWTSKLNVPTHVQGSICAYINWKSYHVSRIWNISYFLIWPILWGCNLFYWIYHFGEKVLMGLCVAVSFVGVFGFVHHIPLG